jgi:alpha-L-fucosidase
MQQRLKDIGDWLKVNGEAIYETTAWKESPKNKPANIFYTRKGNDLYVITTKWAREIEVEGINKAAKISMQGFAGSVRFKKKEGKVLITAPDLNPGNMPCQHAWVYKIDGAF